MYKCPFLPYFYCYWTYAQKLLTYPNPYRLHPLLVLIINEKQRLLSLSLSLSLSHTHFEPPSLTTTIRRQLVYHSSRPASAISHHRTGVNFFASLPSRFCRPISSSLFASLPPQFCAEHHRLGHPSPLPSSSTPIVADEVKASPSATQSRRRTATVVSISLSAVQQLRFCSLPSPRDPASLASWNGASGFAADFIFSDVVRVRWSN
ncbi:hypothetical protein PIB30_088517 [Stylosanthes scabra]|uniref:Uncharacterized protein n=1 Tax=Stylosanthes scabra TaxID=79078 RepID=A0ABU6VU16_9FABA|nr:hypothetical protein [Stylosanthes scabra]